MRTRPTRSGRGYLRMAGVAGTGMAALGPVGRKAWHAGVLMAETAATTEVMF